MGWTEKPGVLHHHHCVGFCVATVCPKHKYGRNCSLPCREICLNQTCDPPTGHCLSCYPGYIGNECEDGKYIMSILNLIYIILHLELNELGIKNILHSTNSEKFPFSPLFDLLKYLASNGLISHLSWVQQTTSIGKSTVNDFFYLVKIQSEGLLSANKKYMYLQCISVDKCV